MSFLIAPSGFRPFERGAIESSVVRRFGEQLARGPERLAVKFGTASLSYAELDEQANRLARAVLAARGQRPEPVAVIVEQGLSLIVAILGVLKAGKFYVPLEAAHPRERLEHMLRDSCAQLAIVSAAAVPVLQGLALPGLEVVDIDGLDPTLPASDPGIDMAADAHAYIYYTTGSTGQPKGVVDSHRNVLHNVMRYTNGLCIMCDDRLTLLQSASFSGAVSSMFAALLNGAGLFPFDLRNSTSQALADYIERERITIYHSVPAIFRSFLHGDRRFPSVRVIRLEGDQSAALDIELFHRHFGPTCVLANGLGATETGITRRYFVSQETLLPSGTVPIGYPVEDMDVFVVDERGAPTTPGVTGEIAVRSEFLACGYWNQPQATERAFLADRTDPAKRIYKTGDLGRMRADGCLEHLGRKDSLSKIRGVTVALAEVEAALHRVPAIREAVVVGRTESGAERRLIAYYVPQVACEPTTSELRRALADMLPPTMIPSAFVRLEQMPLNENLKVDRSNLPAPPRVRPRIDQQYIAARDLTEAQLVQLWEELLLVAPIGVCDDFFDLGGDSLLAIQMTAAVEQETGAQVRLSAMLAGATIEHLAASLAPNATPCGRIVPLQSAGDKPRFFFLHGDYSGGGLYCQVIARELGRDQPFFAVTPCGLDGEHAPATIEEMAERHLRALREVQPHGPYFLGGNCNGGLIALEMAQRLVESGETVERLIVIRASARNVRYARLRRLIDRWGQACGVGAVRRQAVIKHLRWFAQDLASKSTLARLALVLHKARAAFRLLWQGLRRRPWFRLEIDSERPAPGHPPARETLIDTFMTAAADYIPLRYPGAVVVFWPEAEPIPPDEAIKWWRKVAPRAEIEIIPGDHLTAVTVHARSLARRIAAHLALKKS